MAVVVGVHGIAQQTSGPARQFRQWSDAFIRGLKRARFPAETAPTLAVPFYGGLFRKGSPYLGDAATEEGWGDSEVAFVADALGELTSELSDAEAAELDRSSQLLGPPALLPPVLLRGLAVIDRRWGVGRGLLLIGVLRQVHAYLFRPETGDEIRRIVVDRIDHDTRVLVGHSLGSVVVYDLLRRGVAAPHANTLVTLGSPLPLATVRTALWSTGPFSSDRHVSWFNVHDPWDVVTGGQGMRPEATDIKVTNRRSDPHALIEYLGREETARAILSGIIS